MPTELEAVRSDAQWRRPGPTILFWGFAVWSITTAITAMTNDPILMPTVLPTGTFVIPIERTRWMGTEPTSASTTSAEGPETPSDREE
jgi:hypothetical protein